MMNKLVVDLVGRRFGNLTVVRDSGTRNAKREVLWECRCSCGGTALVRTSYLTCGYTTGCGCKRYANGRSPKFISRKGIDRRLERYRRNAKIRDIDWGLTDRAALKMLNGPCYYCGGSPSNGIDRKDSSKSYEESNCVSCCKTCNIAKYTKTVPEFINWIDRVYQHLASSGRIK